MYVAPLPSLEVLKKAYPEEYYTPWLENQRKNRIGMWNKRLKALDRFSGGRGNLLDVGCAEGLFMELAREDGWDVTGTEFSPFAVKYCKEQLGLRVFLGELPDIGFPDKAFDSVTMWHVLEHTTDPVAILKEIRRVLKDDGRFLMAIPNANNFFSQCLYRAVKGRRMHLFNPEDRELHFYHFTPETIALALEKTGFKVLKIQPDMGIVRRRIQILNIASIIIGAMTGRLIADAMEIYARPE